MLVPVSLETTQQTSLSCLCVMEAGAQQVAAAEAWGCRLVPPPLAGWKSVTHQSDCDTSQYSQSVTGFQDSVMEPLILSF